jgi:hypothetical protein
MLIRAVEQMIPGKERTGQQMLEAPKGPGERPE